MSPGDGNDDDLYGGTGQTRTRLPDGGQGDAYGGAARRPARSSSRSLITVVGVVVLLIAAIAFANRGGDESSSGGGDSKKPGASATAPTGTKAVASGFAHDKQGAQSAAANYAVALGSAEMFDKSRRHAIVDSVYAPDVAADRQASLDKVYAQEAFLSSIGLNNDGSAPSGSTFVSRIIPVGTKTTKFMRRQRHRRHLVLLPLRSGRYGHQEPRVRKLVHQHVRAPVDRRRLEGHGLSAEGRTRAGRPRPKGFHRRRHGEGCRAVRRVHVCPVADAAPSLLPQL